VNINLVTSVDGSGYGVVGFNILKALDARGHEVTLFPRQGGQMDDFVLDLPDVALITRCRRRQPLMDMAAPCLRISTEFDMTLFAGQGPRGGLAFFETTRFTDVELRHLGSLDRLFVASEWGRSIAVDNGLPAEAVAVAPMGVDRTIFREGSAAAGDGPGGGPTVFLHVGKWERRKGQDVLVEAFGRAFAPGDAVELQLLCDNPWSTATSTGWLERCRASPMADHIRVIPRVASHREVAALMQAADCGVFPARAEAWNLEALEMLSCGRHVIATDYSGSTQYLDNANAMLIAVDHLEPAADHEWMPVYSERKVGDWAQLGGAQVEQLVMHLRAVHERKQCGELGVNRAGVETAQRFTWENTAQRIIDGFRPTV
jgi:glycosyltransferase involved in cell wall biosynthesis